MRKRTGEGYGQVATEEPYEMAAEIEQSEGEQKQGNGHQQVSQEDLVKLLAPILYQVRNEAAFRPPPLPSQAERAMAEYESMAGAMNPHRSPVLDYTAE